MCGTGCNLVVSLATRHPAARQCLVQLAKDKNATARFNAVIHLRPILPESLRLEIVELALGDRSAKVSRDRPAHSPRGSTAGRGRLALPVLE